MKKYILLLIFLGSASFAQQFSVKVKGQSAGRAELVLNVGKTDYTASLTLYPNMMAKMFGIDDMRDISQGTVRKKHFYPKHYTRKTLDGKSLFSVSFSPKLAKIVNEGKNNQLAINALGQDPLAQIAQIRYNLVHQIALPKTYYLITEKSQQQYGASSQKTESGTQVTLTQKPNGTRVLKLWFDKKNNLQRMQKLKRGKTDFDMRRK